MNRLMRSPAFSDQHEETRIRPSPWRVSVYPSGLVEGEAVASQEDPKDTYRQIIAAISTGDSEALQVLLSDEIVDHNPVPNQAPGLDGFNQWMVAVRTSFPDLEGTVEDVLGEGDRVAGRVIWRGTHGGDFAGITPTNKPVSFSAFHIVRLSGGRATEWWGTADLLGALQQIGATLSGPNDRSSRDG